MSFKIIYALPSSVRVTFTICKSAHTTFKIWSCDFQLNIPIFERLELLLSAVAHCKYSAASPKYIFQIQRCFFLAKVFHSEVALLRKPLKRYMKREYMGVMQPKIWFRFLGTSNIACFRTKYFKFTTFILTKFTTKSYLRSETYIIRIIYALHLKKREVFQENFWIFVENFMQFFICFSSYQVMV